jgi:hypothetical protein
MSNEDERREVAARLREDANCSESSPRFVVESYLGIEYDGTDALEESYKSESLLHLADLIDPTCEVVAFDDESMRLPHCSSCGHPILKPWPKFCPNCGARVAEGSGD